MRSMTSRALTRRARGERGFTLVELLVVVIIIGILAAVSVPVYLNQRKKAWDSNAQSDVKNAMTVTELATLDNGGMFAYMSATPCDGSKGDNRGYVVSLRSNSRSEYRCSAGVSITITFDPSGDFYIISGHHESGSKEYVFDSNVGKMEIKDYTPSK